MSEKTTVTVTFPSGDVTKLEGDTVILFTVDKKLSDTKKSVFVANGGLFGDDIPEAIFPNVIADMVSTFITKRAEFNKRNPMCTAIDLELIAERMKEHSKSMLNEMTLEDKEAAIKHTIKELFKNI